MPRTTSRLISLPAIAILTLSSAVSFSSHLCRSAEPPRHNSQIGQSFQVPYRLTDTNHFLVRARVNGKGPFNFLVDSGTRPFSLRPRLPRKLV